jgi:hypothetical protein
MLLQVQSEAGSADPRSPESRIIELLLKSASGPQRLFSDSSKDGKAKDIGSRSKPAAAAAAEGGENAPDAQAMLAAAPALTAERQQELEALLLVGSREEALALALKWEQFPLAMLIGTVCGREQFQQAVRAFADKSFSPSSSLHFVSMIYSNQASSTLKYGGRQAPERALGGPNSHSFYGSSSSSSSSSSHSAAYRPQPVSWASASPMVRDWRKHLGCILSNKSGDWVDLARTMGERVHSETHVSLP